MKKNRILSIVVIAASVIFLVVNLYRDMSSKRLKVGQKIPEFMVLNEKLNKQVSSSSFEGKVLFINFWATWCFPCRTEMPSINKLYINFSGNKNFKLLIVPFREVPKKSIEYFRQNGFSFPLFVDVDKSMTKKFGVTGVPETYIFSKRGILKKVKIGPENWNSAENFNLIESLLKE